jgi:hypothetical protein
MLTVLVLFPIHVAFRRRGVAESENIKNVKSPIMQNPYP